MKKGVFAHGVMWFGAAVSVAEIETGLQSGGNWRALVYGHLLGGVLLFAAGLLGARSGENAMETTRATFGGWGMRCFALLNVLQLVGWTTIMLSQGAAAVTALAGNVPTVACIAGLALLVSLWVWVGLEDAHHVATIAMVLLAGLAVVLTFRLARLPALASPAPALEFGPAFELSVAMPLSWLPLISDYTRQSTHSVACTAVSATVYTLVSVWMYAIGILLARCGVDGLTDGILACGLGFVGLAVVVISTVTTTFFDAYSAGESLKTMTAHGDAKRGGKPGTVVNPKFVGGAVCALGAVFATTGFVDRYAEFLYAIASVFAPMGAVLLVNRYIVRKRHVKWNFVSWAAGLAAYYLTGDMFWSPTVTSMAVAGTCALVAFRSRAGWTVPSYRI